MPRKTANKVDTLFNGKEVEFKLSPRSEAFNLAAHGTHPARLSTNNLIQTAQSDLRAKELNRRIRAELAKPPGKRTLLADEPIAAYAFGEHVVEASSTVSGLLELAIQFRASVLLLGIEDQSKREAAQRKIPLSTYRVYQDADTLTEALLNCPRETESAAA